MKKEINKINSSYKEHEIFTYIYEPENMEIKGVIQFVHGMTDYVERYEEFASFATKNGYVFYAHDQLGHGRTGENSGEFGYFAASKGYEYMLKDVYKVNQEIHNKYSGLPVVMVGHSMGSYLTRNYLAKFSKTINGAIIMASGDYNIVAPIGIIFIKAMMLIKGGRAQSKLVENLIFGSFNDKFEDGNGMQWLTRDTYLQTHNRNPNFSDLKFTLSGYKDLITIQFLATQNRWFYKVPTNTKILFLSGGMDPLGGYGENIKSIFKKLIKTKHSNVEMKLYKGARHELCHEINREEVFGDIIDWANKI